MPEKTFQALLLNEEQGKTTAAITELSMHDLPEGDVLVKISYSTLNYKDGLAVTGKGKIVRNFPFVPGIDFVGTVEESASPVFKAGDAVILNGWGVGEKHRGGFSQYARVKSDWLIPLPDRISEVQAMGIGTAGYTAMLAVMALEEHGCTPESGEVVVTGATGGVGSTATAILGNLGYRVVAATGRSELEDYLKSLGATRIIPRDELDRDSRPLESGQWAGAIDTVGGRTLATLISTMSYGCSIAAIGLAGGHELHTTVYPFILRGVNLIGIDSVMCPKDRRLRAWKRLSEQLPLHLLDKMIQIVPLSDVIALSEQIVAGQTQGRLVIDVNSTDE